MSSKSKRKSTSSAELQSVPSPSSEIEYLQMEVMNSANIHALIKRTLFIGDDCGHVISALTWLDKKNLAAVEKLKKIAPQLFEQPKTEETTKTEQPA